VVFVAFVGLTLWVFNASAPRSSPKRACCHSPTSRNPTLPPNLKQGVPAMTTFWSTWICVLTIGSLIGLTWLLIGTRKGETKGSVDQTMGHSFDGIEEYDNPLPQWWFMLFAGTLVFSVGYLILYPGLGNWKGILPGYENGWTGVHEWEKEMARPTPSSGRSSPNSPPCRWKKWPRTRKR
jgi:hypothetical protein